MQENLLSPTNIHLFGRVFPLNIDNIPDTIGANRFLRAQLTAAVGDEDEDRPTFARIYAISYEGTFYNLPRPAVYLVYGPGRPVGGGGKARQTENRVLPPNAAGGPGGQPLAATITDSGVVAEDFDFESDVRVWEYDKGDFTLRIDIASGTFDEVLLEATLSVTARDALVSRSDLTSRSDLASRSDVTSRSDLTARHKLRG
jgi:hypothetical protein